MPTTPSAKPPRCLITGVRGQDGTYLARELRGQGCEVIGLTSSADGVSEDGVRLLTVDYANVSALRRLLDEAKPDRIYHLASPSCLSGTREFEEDVFRLNVSATHVFLRWIHESSPTTRFFFAGSSEIFGDPVESPQNEGTRPSPAHPYAVAKLAGQQLAEYFRREKGVFACTGILYNNESPLRRAQFVTRKITQGVVAISRGEKTELSLGNLQARRDWSHAADFASAFSLILKAEEPADYVIGSGVSHTVAEFCEIAFAELGLDYREYVKEDPRAFRPDFAFPRLADPARLRALGWVPRYDLWGLIREMVQADLSEA